MTQPAGPGIPPQLENSAAADNTLAYAVPGPRMAVLGVVAMALGVGSIALSVAGVLGAGLGLVALVVGIVARVLIDRNPQRLAGAGYANVGIATGILGGVMFLFLAPCLCGKPRELSNRSVCAANLRGLMQAASIYAADNAGAFPVVSPTGGYGLAAAGGGTPNVDPLATIKSIYASPPVPSVTQNMWLLVLRGDVAPKQFICKSDASAVPAASSAAGGACFTNFNDGKTTSDLSYSYSFAYPWTAAGKVGDWWKDSMDAGLPLMADMAPVEGTGNPAATPADGRNRNANSFTHQRNGQNVAFGDAHAEFQRVAAVGEGHDNIYTGNGGTPGERGLSAGGRAPNIGTGGTPGNWDVCLVPAADGKTGNRK